MLRGYVCPPPLTFDCLSYRADFFESALNMLPSSGKLLRNSNLQFKKRYFEETLFTLRPPTLACAAQSVLHKSIVPGREFVRGRDRHTKEIWGPQANVKF